MSLLSHVERATPVSLPVLQHPRGKAIHILPLAVMETKEAPPRKEGDDPGTITLLKVIDLEAESAAQYVCGTVLEKTLNEQYENGGYVGKAFTIEKQPKAGKSYNAFTITELTFNDKGIESLSKIVNGLFGDGTFEALGQTEITTE